MLKLTSFSMFLLLSSCNINHRYQSSYKPLEGHSSMTPPEGAVRVYEDQSRPVLTRESLSKGQKLYNINCAVCHGLDGSGDSIAVKRGLTPPDSLHEKELDDKAEDYYFNIMTEGYGRMLSFRHKLTSSERWSVAAYIEALRLSRNMPFEKLDAKDKGMFP